MSEPIKEPTLCEHEMEWGEEKLSSGENIVGKEAMCYGQDGVCRKCGTKDWRRTNDYPRT